MVTNMLQLLQENYERVFPLPIIVVTLCFILFDVITGLLKAVKCNKLNSTLLRQGLLHKLSEVLCVVGAFAAPYGLQQMQVDFKLPLLEGVGVYICLMETISAIENLCEVNPKLNKLFAPYLEKLKKKDDKDE